MKTAILILTQVFFRIDAHVTLVNDSLNINAIETINLTKPNSDGFIFETSLGLKEYKTIKRIQDKPINVSESYKMSDVDTGINYIVNLIVDKYHYIFITNGNGEGDFWVIIF